MSTDHNPQTDAERVDYLLQHIDPETYDDHNWTTISAAIGNATSWTPEGFAIFAAWARRDRQHDDSTLRARWQILSRKTADTDGMGFLVALAKGNGATVTWDYEWTGEQLKGTTIQSVLTEWQCREDGPAKVLAALNAEAITNKEAIPFGRMQGVFDYMDATHTPVKMGSEVMYIDAADQRDARLRLMSATGLKAALANCHIVTFDDKGKQGQIPLFNGWHVRPERPLADGIGFFPGTEQHPAKTPANYINTWRGFAIAPDATKPCDLIVKHIRDVVCAGDEAGAEWMLDWLADIVQHPSHKLGTEVVLFSTAQGSGKSTVGEIMRRIIGRHCVPANNSEAVIGRFNAHQEECLLLVADEAVWSGSKATADKLKSLVTEEQLSVEGKGLPIRTVPSYMRLLRTTNNEHAVHLDKGSRRTTVFEVSDKYASGDSEAQRKANREYFGPLWQQINDGGCAGFLAFLQARQIKSDLRTCHVTDALSQQRMLSLDPFDAFLVELAKGDAVGGNGSAFGIAHDTVQVALDASKVPMRRVAEACKAVVGNGHTQQTVSKMLRLKLNAVGIEVGSARVTEGGKQFVTACAKLPGLDEYRDRVSQRLNIDKRMLADSVVEFPIAAPKKPSTFGKSVPVAH